jgi:hypothetical protein
MSSFAAMARTGPAAARVAGAPRPWGATEADILAPDWEMRAFPPVGVILFPMGAAAGSATLAGDSPAGSAVILSPGMMASAPCSLDFTGF